MNAFRAAGDRLDDAVAHEAAIPFDALRGAVAASYTLLFAERVEDRQVESPVVEGVDQGYGTRLQFAATERLLPPWLCGLDEGIVVDRAAMARDRDFAHSAFFDYVIRPEGRFHCLIATPYVTPTRRYHLIVGRPFRAADFGQADACILRALMPYVAQLIRLENDAAAAHARSDDLLAAFDCLAENVIVLSGRAQVAFANAGAKRILALKDGLRIERSTLRGADPAATSLLAEAVAAVTAPDGPDEVAVHLPRPSRCPPLQVRVRRTAGAAEASGTPNARAVLLIQQPEPEHLVDGWSVGRIYGLTARELDVAVLLARGCDLRSTAAELGMSYQTARFHLRRVFAKTDLHRQSDLVRLVLNASPQLRW